MKLSSLLLFLSLAPCICSAEPSPLRVDVTRDLWISSYEKEREGNNGGSPKLKLKGIQEFFLIDFDPAPFKGKQVVRAELHLHPEGAESLGRITVSSVAEEWVEGTGSSYARVPGASSFSWARTGEQRWRDVDVTGAIHGAGGSVWGFGDSTPRDTDGWQVIPVSPEVVQARLDGLSHGFSVMDDVGSEYTRHGDTIEYRQFPNRYVASREGPHKTAPYFTLWLDDGPVKQTSPTSTLPKSTVAAKLPLLSAPPHGTSQIPPFPARDELGEPLTSLDFSAARNETIGFYLEAPTAGSVVQGAAGLQVSMSSMRKVEGHYDPLVPAGWKSAPNPEDAGTFVEVYVPRDATKGTHEITLTLGGKSVTVAVRVWNFSLPDHLSFIPQMNCYGLPGHERDYYRLAHEHRTTLNMLPYGWTGRVKAAPKIDARGQWDWRAWDAEYGPLLDGSAFVDTRRGPVPVEAFYLPLNENWPMDHERHFRGGYWIENAYDDSYWQEFRDATAQFAKHFAEKKWTEPVFEFYLNNKVYFKRDRGNRWDACSAPWILDEPVNTQDFWALRKFGIEFWRGANAFSEPHFAFRADISRPEWQRDILDGVTNSEVISGVLRTYRDRVIGRARQFKKQIYMYGSANRLGTPNIMPAAWCVETWALGADGVVPWQTIGKEGSWTKADELSLFYPTPDGPVPSLRLKSFRAGEQLVEYLTIYCALTGEDRDAVGDAVLAEPGMHATLKKKSEADAGDSLFGPEAHHTLTALRQRLGEWLNTKAPAPRDRWHDPRPAPQDPDKVRPITALPPPQ